MGWMRALAETYDNYYNGEPLNDASPLVQVGFVEKKIEICVRIDSKGEFHSAEILPNGKILNIPSSPAAEGRTGDSALPFPLNEQMQYVAGDLSESSKYFDAYLSKLKSWCNRDDAPDELKLLLSYIEKRTLKSDLVINNFIKLDKNGVIPSKYYKMIVDFLIQLPEEEKFESLAKLDSIRKSWEKYLLSEMEESGVGLCYASGEKSPLLENHAKIEGNAKLISAKDGDMLFQYKGRFTSSNEACLVSYEHSAKIHNTIRWIRDKQSFRRFGMTFMTWSTNCRGEVITADEGFDEGFIIDEADEIAHRKSDTEEEYAYRVNRTLLGLRKEPMYKKDSQIVMMGMEAATPGRMSINFYEEFDGSRYLEMLGKWYKSCMWRMYNKDGKLYINTPNIYDIGFAVFGDDNMLTAKKDFQADKAITKQVKRFTSDIFTCIASGKKVPLIYTNAAYHRVLNPNRFLNNKNQWNRDSWEKSMAITLAMFRSSYESEGYNVALNKNETQRDYLYGRLLAVADVIETVAMSMDDNKGRQTNAVRCFTAMQQRPANTWKNLYQKLIPYIGKIKNLSKRENLVSLIDEIYSMGIDGEISQNKPLSPRFLEGYHNQRYELLKKGE